MSAQTTENFDLVIVGTGSGNMIVDHRFDDWSVAIVERRTFGGTCLNRGCIPSKMLIYPADVIESAASAARLGVSFAAPEVDWPAIRDRVFAHIDDNARSGREGRAEADNVTVVEGEARFVSERTLEVETEHGVRRVAGRHVVLATGSRPVVPDIDGLDELNGPTSSPPGEPDDPDRHGTPADWYTSDDVMRMATLPRRLAILGGGYIGCELAHAFSAFGSEVTQVDVAPTLLSNQDADVAEMFTRFARRRWDVRTETGLTGVARAEDGGIALTLEPEGDGPTETVTVDALLLAVGRVPNGDRLDLDAAGVRSDDGLVEVDERLRTTAEGVWALGDASSDVPLKHSANHDARVVQHNLLHADDPDRLVEVDHSLVPSAVFSSPQVAAVGLTEQEAREQHGDVAVIEQDYGDVAYGWAMEDDHLPETVPDKEGSGRLRHFVKLIADPATGRLLGAHLIGPQASILNQPLIDLAVSGEDVRGRARRTWWVHPALPEVVEQALLALESELT